MKIYVAGPMRGLKDFNFQAFFKAESTLHNQGHEVFNPAHRDTDAYGFALFASPHGSEKVLTDKGFSMREAMAADTDWICRHAEAVYTLSGWENSRGARSEVALAEALDLKVVHGHFELAPVGLVDCCDSTPHPAHTPGEEMSVSSTGGMKGTKLARFDLIPVGALTEVAKHYGRTAGKYPPNNWRKGFEWSKSYAALQRHVTEWWGGQDTDAELGSPHLAAVAWHALTLLEFASTHPERDDRPKDV